MTWAEREHVDHERRKVLRCAETLLSLLDVVDAVGDCDLTPRIDRATAHLDEAVRDLAALLKP